MNDGMISITSDSTVNTMHAVPLGRVPRFEKTVVVFFVNL